MKEEPKSFLLELPTVYLFVDTVKATDIWPGETLLMNEQLSIVASITKVSDFGKHSLLFKHTSDGINYHMEHFHPDTLLTRFVLKHKDQK